MTTVHNWLSSGTGGETPIDVAGVLTCMAAPGTTDAFRPGYCDRTQKIYCADSLRWYFAAQYKTGGQHELGHAA